MTSASATPMSAPTICATSYPPACDQLRPPCDASATDTAGLKCAPEMGPNVRIRATKAAPVATVFANSATYVGSQGRNLFLRSVANQITEVHTNLNPALAAQVVREFSIVTRNASGYPTSVQNPYAEVDFKTSGGHDNYNALMLSLNRWSVGRTVGLGTPLQLQFALRFSF